ncbi:hypothetical protein MRX96_031042 [Rhipicephalus microplus]
MWVKAPRNSRSGWEGKVFYPPSSVTPSKFRSFRGRRTEGQQPPLVIAQHGRQRSPRSAVNGRTILSQRDRNCGLSAGRNTCRPRSRLRTGEVVRSTRSFEEACPPRDPKTPSRGARSHEAPPADRSRPTDARERHRRHRHSGEQTRPPQLHVGHRNHTRGLT